MHGDSTVALAGKSVTQPEECFSGFADQGGDFLDPGCIQTGNGRSPFRCPCLEMRFEFGRAVRVGVKIVAIRVAVAKKHVHDRAGERCVRSRLQNKADIGLFHGLRLVDIDNNDARAAFSCARQPHGSFTLTCVATGLVPQITI